MEKVSVSKELMKDLHLFMKTGDSNSVIAFSDRIESELPELFKPKFEVGRWYKFGDNLFRIKRVKVNGDLEVDNSNYLNNSTDFAVRKNSAMYDYCTVPTPQEIKTHLIKLAEKKGFVKEALVYPIEIRKQNVSRGTYQYDYDKDELWLQGQNNNIKIYSKGDWATFVLGSKTIDRKAEVSKAFLELQNRVDDLLNNL